MNDAAQPTYDLTELARSNWHVHTAASRCADADMTARAIVVAAEKAGLREVALVDHHSGVDTFVHDDILDSRAQIRAELETFHTNVRVHVGAELSAQGVGSFSDSIDVNRRIGFRLYACNHYHLNRWEHPRERTPRGYAEHMLAVLRSLLPSGRADCVAHPFSTAYLGRRLAAPREAGLALTDAELGEILELGKAKGVAWEIHRDSCLGDPAFARRFWNIGRETGVEFRFGTDAHSLADIDPAPVLPLLRSILS